MIADDQVNTIQRARFDASFSSAVSVMMEFVPENAALMLAFRHAAALLSELVDTAEAS